MFTIFVGKNREAREKCRDSFSHFLFIGSTKAPLKIFFLKIRICNSFLVCM